MKNVINIIANSRVSLCLLLVCCFVMSCSSNKKERFEIEIKMKPGSYYQGQIYLPLLIYTRESPLMLIYTDCLSITKEIRDYNSIDKESAGTYLYSSLKQKSPIQVSSEYYQKNKANVIRVNPEVDSIYKKMGIVGVLNHYCDDDGTLETVPLDENGKNWGYIVYLLSLYDIYVAYFYGCEDPIKMVFIANWISNLP